MTSGHVFRNPDKVQQLPERDYIRDHCMGASAGLSVLDVDLVILLYGDAVGRKRDEDGKFMLVEIKAKGVRLNYTQQRLLELMHRLLREADPGKMFYIGSYILHWDYEENKPVSINYKPITEVEFVEWVEGRRLIQSAGGTTGDDHK